MIYSTTMKEDFKKKIMNVEIEIEKRMESTFFDIFLTDQ